MKIQNEFARKIFMLVKQKLGANKLRYLLAGGWNTVFGYSTGLVLYTALSNRLHVIVIGLLANIAAITMSFLTYKLFVFRTRGNWLQEYLRAYLVYGAMALLGIGLLWIMVDGGNIPFWIAQGLTVVVVVAVSYFSHSRFTFRRQG